MTNLKDQIIREAREEFEKKYPISYGNPFPHFIDTPVATHIMQFMDGYIDRSYQAGVKDAEKGVSEALDQMNEAAYAMGLQAALSEAAEVVHEESIKAKGMHAATWKRIHERIEQLKKSI